MGKKYSVKAFPQEYVTLWKEAIDRTMRFKLPYNQAVKARQTLYQLRIAMEREKHPMWPFLAPLSISFNPTKVNHPTDPVEMQIGKRPESLFLAMVKEEVGEKLEQERKEIQDLDLSKVVKDEVDAQVGEIGTSEDHRYDDLFPEEGEEDE